MAAFGRYFLAAVADHGADPADAMEAAALALEQAEWQESLPAALAILEQATDREHSAMLAILDEGIRRLRHDTRLSMDGVPEDDPRRQTRPLLPGDLYRATFIPAEELVEPGQGGGPTNPVAEFAPEPRPPKLTGKAKGKARGKGRAGRHRHHRRRLGRALRVPRKWRELA
jgi:hypothetical protein